MKKKIISVILALCITLTCFPLFVFAQSNAHTVLVSTSIVNGQLLTDKSSATEGETVVVTITPNEGYITRAGSVYYTYDNGGTITKALVNHTHGEKDGYQMQFVMPNYDVKVYAEFVSDETNAFSFDIIGSSVRSTDGSFESGTFNGIRFYSRCYFPKLSRATSTGKIKVRKSGVRSEIGEMGILYAKTSSFGTETEMSIDNVGNNGIRKVVSFSSEDPMNDNLFESTSTFVDSFAEITGSSSISLKDYTARAYIKFVDGDTYYSAEKTDFAENVAKRLNLCEIENNSPDTTLSVDNTTPVNSDFSGFGVVIYPWTVTCLNGTLQSAVAKAKAYTELDRMQAAGIHKVRIIISNIPTTYYDFDNKTAKSLKSDWYTDLWLEMLNALKERNIDVMLNFFWGDSIKTLSNGKLTSVLPTSVYGSLSLDEQITAYGQLAASFVDYFLDNGCSNVKSISFYSEPGNGWNGSNNAEAKSLSAQLNFDSVITTYGKCVASAKQQLNKLGRADDVDLVSGNISMLYDSSSGYDWWNITSWGGYSFLSAKNWFKTMLSKTDITNNSDSYTLHYYGKYNNVKVSNYNYNIAALNAIKNNALNNTGYSVNDIIMDEVSVRDISANPNNNKSTLSAFEATQLAQYAVAIMNTGYKGAYFWTFSDIGNDNMYGFMPNALSSTSLPYSRYYAMSLMCKYINKCNIIYAGTYSDGCISTFGTDTNGNKVLMVVNMNTTKKTICVNFDSPCGDITFNRHLYNPSVNPITEQANSIGIDKKLSNVSTFLTDTLPAGGIAIYTTANN